MRIVFRASAAFTGFALAVALSAAAASALEPDGTEHPNHGGGDCSACWVDEGMGGLSEAEQLQVMEDLYGLDGENTKNLTDAELAQLYADLGGEGNEDSDDNGAGGKKRKAPVEHNGRSDHSNDHSGGGNGGHNGGNGGGRNADGSPK